MPMRTVLLSLALVALVACESGNTWYEQRCSRAGIEAGTAAMERCIAREIAYMRENRGIINRIYGQ